MTTKQFIEKAIEGGWNDKYYRTVHHSGRTSDEIGAWFYYDSLFLDPLAWKAVAKSCKWSEVLSEVPHGYIHRDSDRMAQINMSRMVDALWEGKTIEEFLKTL